MCLQTGFSAWAERACKRGVLPKSLDTVLSLMVPCKRGSIPFLWQEGKEGFGQTLQETGISLPLLYDNMYAPVLYWKGLFMQSKILPRGLYNNKPQIVCAVLFLQPECVLSVSCVSHVFCLCVISLTTPGAHRGARVKRKGWVTLGGF